MNNGNEGTIAVQWGQLLVIIDTLFSVSTFDKLSS